MSKSKKITKKVDSFISKLNNRTIVIIAFIAVMGGLLLISYDYLKGKKDMAYQKVSISLYSETADNTPQNI